MGPRRSLASAEPIDHRQQVGGLWEELGIHQFRFLVEQGLRPSHYLLDVGCGSLRGGLHFVEYLEARHYYGIDADQRLLAAGELELEAAGTHEKAHTLRHTSTFDVDFGRRFDFVLAQSVFTHLPLNVIQRCLLNVQHVMTPSARFFATFFLNPRGKNDIREIVHPHKPGLTPTTTYMDRDPYHYSLSAFEWVCSETSLLVEYVGEWGHPRGQQILVFRRR